MGDLVRIVRINIEEQESGLLSATSEDLPGMVIVHREMKAIRDDLPNVIQLLFKRRYDLDVEVREAAIGNAKPAFPSSYAAIPSRIEAHRHAAE